MCRCLRIDPEMQDARFRPGRYSPENHWQAWYDAEYSRIVGIGAERLKAWSARCANQTHPESYAATSHELASAIGYALRTGGGVTKNQRYFADHEDADFRWHARLEIALIETLS